MFLSPSSILSVEIELVSSLSGSFLSQTVHHRLYISFMVAVRVFVVVGVGWEPSLVALIVGFQLIEVELQTVFTLSSWAGVSLHAEVEA